MKKTPPGIRPRNKCAKFQPNPTIFEVSRLPQSFKGTDTHTHTQTFSDPSSTEVENINFQLVSSHAHPQGGIFEDVRSYKKIFAIYYNIL